jgi:hypothetical protein
LKRKSAKNPIATTKTNTMAISGPSLFLEAACGSAFVPFFAPDESSEIPGNMKKKKKGKKT